MHAAWILPATLRATPTKDGSFNKNWYTSDLPPYIIDYQTHLWSLKYVKTSILKKRYWHVNSFQKV